jgi:hypothetical protein
MDDVDAALEKHCEAQIDGTLQLVPWKVAECCLLG